VILNIVVYGHVGENSPSQKKVSCDGVEEAYYFWLIIILQSQKSILCQQKDGHQLKKLS